MPDLLKVPTSGVTHENIPKAKPGEPTTINIPNIPDATRVTGANPQNIHDERQPGKFSRAFDSNYDKFLQLIRLFPDIGQMYKEIFFMKTGSLVNAGIGENFAAEIAEYMELMKMSESELLSFLKSQFNSATKFSGPIFSVFREIFANTESESLKTAILDMLRKFDGMSSSSHILNEIMSNLKSIAKQMQGNAAHDLRALSESLIQNAAKNAGGNPVAENLNILKNDIIPFLSKYISITHDFGSIRDLITMFTLNLARYELCSTDNFMQSLRNVFSFGEVASKFTPQEMKILENLFTSANIYGINNGVAHSEGTGNEEANKLISKLLSIIGKGMESNIPQTKAVFENILHSILANESVYMPLLHIIIPADINGQLLFSEMWVDPEDENSENGGDGEKTAKLLIKFDIKNVGYFEIIILSKGAGLDMQLFYPERFASMEEQIRISVNEIARRNQLSLNTLLVERLTTPKSISEVFPKIYERKNAINVTV